jgi:DNA-binding IclR family transcriptional regulator
VETFVIQVVNRAFDVLELLAQENRCLGTSEIAARIGISVQSANNLLRTLYERGYVSQDKSRQYRLGVQCFYLGSFADRWGRLRTRLAEPLKALAASSSFTAFVGVMENDRLLSIASLNPGETSLALPPQSWWDELHSTACGRILLASLSATERAKLFARTTRKKLTAATIVDSDALESICEQIAGDGYCEVCNESRAGVSSLAVPLHDISGKVFAGLAIATNDEHWRQVPFLRRLQYLTDTVAKLELN